MILLAGILTQQLEVNLKKFNEEYGINDQCFILKWLISESFVIVQDTKFVSIVNMRMFLTFGTYSAKAHIVSDDNFVSLFRKEEVLNSWLKKHFRTCNVSGAECFFFVKKMTMESEIETSIEINFVRFLCPHI